MTDLSQLSDEEVNVRLAELAGYKWTRWGNHPDAMLFLVPPDFPSGSFVPSSRKLGEAFRWSNEPRYCSSLDECAKVEAGLTDEQRIEYGRCLLNGLKFTRLTFGEAARLATATARQRAEALIATLQP